MTVLITKSLQKQGINDHMKAFKQAMLNAGMPNVPDSIYITSGDVTRWKDTNKQGNNKDCWYIFGINSNGTGFGKFGNHKDIRAKWHSSHNKKLPNLKLTKQQQRICKEAKTLTDQAIKQVKEFCIEKARELWNSARPITKQNEHPWLIQKKIPFDIFKITTHNFSFQLPDTKKKQIIYKGALLLPIWNPNNEIVSLQYIGQKPNEKEKYQKYTFPRTSVKNGVTILGNIKSSELVYISESVSTGYTVLKASGLPVICGAGKAGFKHCIEFVKKNYPKKEIILIGDNDLTNTDVNGKPYNDGKIAVEKAAKEYNLKYVLSPVESDFNDLFVQELQQTNDERIAYAKVKEALKNIQTPEAKKKQKIPLSGYIKEPEPFPLEALPEPFVPWAKEIVYHMQCPPEFIALSVMTTLSSFIARKSTIKPENFSNWFVIPNLWGMLIADIGVSKSPPQKELIKMITPFQIKANQDFEKAQKEYKQQVWAYKQALKKAGKEFEKSKDVTKKPLDFLTPNIKEPEEPQQFHYFTTDHTPEALSKLLIVNSCPFIWCDEIKRLIKKFDSKGHEGERQDFLSLYDGTTQNSIRATIANRSSHNSSIALLGSIQPKLMDKYIKTIDSDSDDNDGLFHRFIMFSPTKNIQWQKPTKNFDKQTEHKINDLFYQLDTLKVSEIGAKERDSGTPYFEFDTEAQKYWDIWREPWQNTSNDLSIHSIIRGHMKKMTKAIAGIALIIHIAEGQTGAVSSNAITKAIFWAELINDHAKQLFSSVLHKEETTAHLILRKIESGDITEQFTVSSITNSGWAKLQESATVKSACQVLCEHNYIEQEKQDLSKGGRPTEKFRIL